MIRGQVEKTQRTEDDWCRSCDAQGDRASMLFLLAWAQWYADQGRPVAASALRWAVNAGRYPERYPPHIGGVGTAVCRWIVSNTDHDRPRCVPVAVFRSMVAAGLHSYSDSLYSVARYEDVGTAWLALIRGFELGAQP